MESMIPEFVRQTDGTLEPFEPERITRCLFAVAERLGIADAFLSRELTESITHFLEAEATSSVLLSSEIADTVVRVVRELGHPALAKAYEDRSTRSINNEIATAQAIPLSDRINRRHLAGRLVDTEFSLKHLFPRELVAAHEEGLITIGGLESPMELAGRVSDSEPSFLRRLRHVGEYLVEETASWTSRSLILPANRAEELFQSSLEFATLGDVRVFQHFQLSASADESGPTTELFPSDPTPSLADIREFLWELAKYQSSQVSWYWHLSANNPDDALNLPLPDFQSGEFVFDHPKRPRWLGPGLTTESKASLIRIGVNFARLFEMLGDKALDGPTLLSKASALVRFAKTAGHVKQDWLRRHGNDQMRSAFLLDRAPVVIVPLGLVSLNERLGIVHNDTARQLLSAIRLAVETDRPRQIPVVIDSDWTNESTLAELSAESTRNDWKLVGQLCLAINGGRIDCRLNGNPEASHEIIRLAAKSGVQRLRFLMD